MWQENKKMKSSIFLLIDSPVLVVDKKIINYVHVHMWLRILTLIEQDLWWKFDVFLWSFLEIVNIRKNNKGMKIGIESLVHLLLVFFPSFFGSPTTKGK